ncbi:hypothetical protein D9M71_827200 [compost metagenome]
MNDPVADSTTINSAVIRLIHEASLMIRILLYLSPNHPSKGLANTSAAMEQAIIFAK